MPKVDVSKLDAMLSVLRPVSAPKPRGALIRVYVHYDVKRSEYIVQVGAVKTGHRSSMTWTLSGSDAVSASQSISIEPDSPVISITRAPIWSVMSPVPASVM